jgi:alpha-tubulin suppressor-like RCC1 family protein
MRHLLTVFLGLLALLALLALDGDMAGASVQGAATISAGGFHTCAVTTAGGVKCWGSNGTGQLGDGTTTTRYTPVDVSGLTSGVATVAAGPGRTCAVSTAGGVKCWGSNPTGQLGDGTTKTRTTPVDASGLTFDVAAISVGTTQTCAVTTAGGAKCWGRNEDGQLGDGTTTHSTSPVDVSGLTSGVAAISASSGSAGGTFHTCALTTAGGVKCWGKNDEGQLGAPADEECRFWGTCSTTPVDVSGLTSGVAAVSAGEEHTCALTTAGGVKCWGWGDTTPVDVSGLTSGVAAVAAGWGHNCAVTTAGGVKCWGRNSHGQLGDGTTTRSTTPVDVSGLTSGVASVTAGFSHTCALTTEGGVKCWGRGDTTPVDVVGFGAEPTPTPGLAPELPRGGGMPPTSDARTDGWWAPLLGGVASVVLALAAGAWYARRRWLR